MTKLKPIDYEIISGLVKNPRLSDRQLAKILRTSQPTVTRRRGQLEKDNLLKYTAIPNMKELGFEILAITLGNRAAFPKTAQLNIQKAQDFNERHHCIIFNTTGAGLNSDRVIVSVHEDYADYSRFYRELRQEWEQIMVIHGSFIVSLRSDVTVRPLTFDHVPELAKEKILEEKKTKEKRKNASGTKNKN
jgi:DNA-binding Lrp family transcriptional regulator